MMKEKCNTCGKLIEIKKLISGTCWKCREKELKIKVKTQKEGGTK